LGRSSCWRRIHNTDFFTATSVDALPAIRTKSFGRLAIFAVNVRGYSLDFA